MISVTICSPERAQAAPWDDLARRASPNVFMNPAALRTAQSCGFADVRVLLAWDEGASPRRLVGLWALRRRVVAPLLPAILEALPFYYAFLSSPVVDPAFAGQVMPAFLAAIERDPALPKVITLKSLDAEAPSYAALRTALTGKGGEQLELKQFARPFASKDHGVKHSGATRKKLRQDWNRLSAQGAVELLNDRSEAAASAAFEIFLALEAGGWKGKRGTALTCDPADARFTRELIRALAARGDASVALLRVDGKAIAAQVLMYCGTRAYTWKTGYDAKFGKFSPGALLIDKLTEQLFAEGAIETIDSCSVQDSFMAQLWSGRRSMVDLVVGVGPGRSFGFAVEAARQLGIARLRELRNRLRAFAAPRPAAPKKPAVAGQA
ncbi:MAG TPA: GNAT family N-acetyltransferase [Rhodopseudomonas sp.]|uniref:GNAT family N-acetyltransferase n=1 Tax=Rhodopseudomonas sp. TaxID=1078 RepID=UPI002ED8F75E